MPNGRCRIHGGKSPGAPTGKGNGNYKNGKHTKRHKQFVQATKAIKVAIRQNDYKAIDKVLIEVEALLDRA